MGDVQKNKLTKKSYFYSSEYMDIIITEKVGTHINAPKTYNKAPTSFSVDEIHLKDLVNVPGWNFFI